MYKELTEMEGVDRELRPQSALIEDQNFLEHLKSLACLVKLIRHFNKVSIISEKYFGNEY